MSSAAYVVGPPPKASAVHAHINALAISARSAPQRRLEQPSNKRREIPTAARVFFAGDVALRRPAQSLEAGVALARCQAGASRDEAEHGEAESERTLVISTGRDPTSVRAVNPPVWHASTITFPSVAALRAGDKNPFDGPYYGRWGTPTTFAVEEVVAKLEGGYRAIATSSGNAAMSTTLLSLLSAGDHILVCDTVYEPTRKFCSDILARYGVKVTFFAPSIGAGIEELFENETKVVFLEAPGSLTFEIPDVPAISTVAKKHGATVIMDNTWATPLFFKAFDHGVDISLHAATKYLCGHSDAMSGFIVLKEEKLYRSIKGQSSRLGCCPGPDDCYLVLRGIRTLPSRMKVHEENALALARWLQGREEVEEVLHPALESFPGFQIWKRDFKGSSGLFSVVLKEKYSELDLEDMVDGFKHFKIGFSWGGFESLALPFDPRPVRTASQWNHPGPCVRFHAGLEDVNDLIQDLEVGLQRLNDSYRTRSS
eukprot:tig00001049_g6658.t1